MRSRYCSETRRCGRCCQRRVSLLFRPAVPSALTAKPSLSGSRLTAALFERGRLVGCERAGFFALDKVFGVFFGSSYDVRFDLRLRSELAFYGAGGLPLRGLPLHFVASLEGILHMEKTRQRAWQMRGFPRTHLKPHRREESIDFPSDHNRAPPPFAPGLDPIQSRPAADRHQNRTYQNSRDETEQRRENPRAGRAKSAAQKATVLTSE